MSKQSTHHTPDEPLLVLRSCRYQASVLRGRAVPATSVCGTSSASPARASCQMQRQRHCALPLGRCSEGGIVAVPNSQQQRRQSLPPAAAAANSLSSGTSLFLLFCYYERQRHRGLRTRGFPSAASS